MMLRLLTCFLFFSLIFGAPTNTTITPPAEDDFYQPQEGYEDKEVGSILKWRETPHPIKSVHFKVNIKKSWQMLVRSEDSLGNPTAIVASVFEPYNANSSRLVSYNIAEDAAAFRCSPSYSFMGGGGISTIVGQLEMFLIQSVLDQGYYVVSADYEGLLGSFTVGRMSGQSVLNSIRAVLSTGKTTGIDSDAETILWGYSGGTIAGGWAAALQPLYAPDLSNNLIGAALGGFVTNITSTAEVTDGTIFAGLIPNAVTGLTHQYEELNEIVKEEIKPTKMIRYKEASDFCLVDSILYYAFDHIFTGNNSYTKDQWALFERDEVKEVIANNSLGVEATEDLVPECPIFVYHGVKDEIVTFKDAQRVYDVWCAEGIPSFEFAVSKSTGHILEVIEGTGAALRWIINTFEGVPRVDGCKRTERLTNLLYPGALRGYGEIISAAIANIFGFEIGPSDSENVKRFYKEELQKRGLVLDI